MKIYISQLHKTKKNKKYENENLRKYAGRKGKKLVKTEIFKNLKKTWKILRGNFLTL